MGKHGATKYTKLLARTEYSHAGAIGGRFDHCIASISFLYKIHSNEFVKENLPPNVG